jgi:hypothetical protein
MVNDEIALTLRKAKWRAKNDMEMACTCVIGGVSCEMTVLPLD